MSLEQEGLLLAVVRFRALVLVRHWTRSWKLLLTPTVVG